MDRAFINFRVRRAGASKGARLHELTIRDVKSRQRIKVDIEGYATKGYPSDMLDVIEIFYSLLDDKAKAAGFQQDINESMLAFACPWRLADGCFFQVDSEFINREILERSTDLMAVARFQGALEEFREAREDLAAATQRTPFITQTKASKAR